MADNPNKKTANGKRISQQPHEQTYQKAQNNTWFKAWRKLGSNTENERTTCYDRKIRY